MMQAFIQNIWNEIAHAHQGRGYILYPICIGLGIAAYFALLKEPPIWLGGMMTALSIVSLWGMRSSKFRLKITILLLCVSIGFAAIQLRVQLIHSPMLKNETGPIKVHGRVIQVQKLDKGQRIVLTDLGLQNISPEHTPRKVRIKLRSEQHFDIGDKVSGTVGLSPPSPPVFPGSFDFQRHMYFQGIGGLGFAYGDLNIEEKTKSQTFRAILENTRTRITENLKSKMTDGAGVAAALMVGQKSAISENDTQAMRDAGLAHMLAISGLHIGLFAGTVFFLARFCMALLPGLALNMPIKKIAALCAILAAFFYMMIAGATIPTQRAFIMTGIAFLAIMIDRSPLSLRLVAFAACIILLTKPESLVGVSFQMSFSAVVALVVFFDQTRDFWFARSRRRGIFSKLMTYILGVIATTMVATLATAPFALFHFQKLALYSVLANMIAMPILAIAVMPLIVLYFIAAPLGLEIYLLPMMDIGIKAILTIAHSTASLPNSVLKIPQMPLIAFINLCAALGVLTLAKAQIRLIAAPLIIFIIIIISVQKQPFMLISSGTDLIAYVGNDTNMHLNDYRKERFIREKWQDALAIPPSNTEHIKKYEAQNLKCGEEGCRIEHHGSKISILHKEDEIAIECQWADIIITQEPTKQHCNTARIIDPFDTYKTGTIALYSTLKGYQLKTAQEGRGDRPWVQ